MIYLFLSLALVLTPGHIVSTPLSVNNGVQVSAFDSRQVLSKSEKICRDYLEGKMEGFPEWKKEALVTSCEHYLLVGRRSHL